MMFFILCCIALVLIGLIGYQWTVFGRPIVEVRQDELRRLKRERTVSLNDETDDDDTFMKNQ
eukprot:m.63946 g.63946  ORF g.63946 m.63946 type:complete len:62 (+) comp11614_c1_seq2:41-226(+)